MARRLSPLAHLHSSCYVNDLASWDGLLSGSGSPVFTAASATQSCGDLSHASRLIATHFKHPDWAPRWHGVGMLMVFARFSYSSPKLRFRIFSPCSPQLARCRSSRLELEHPLFFCLKLLCQAERPGFFPLDWQYF